MSRKNLFNIDNLSAQDIDENSELIPLMTPEDELEISKEELPQTLPILSLRNTVLFPGVVIPITASRDKSIRLIKDANNFNKLIGVVAQKDESVEDPKLKDIYNIGTVAKIIKVLQMPDGNTTVIIQGKKRFEIERVISETPYITSNIKDNPEAAIIIPDKDIIPGAETLSPAYIVFENYEKILNWNRSLRFALAVCTLKENFKNEI